MREVRVVLALAFVALLVVACSLITVRLPGPCDPSPAPKGKP